MMNLPTLLLAALVAAVFAAIVIHGARKRKRGGPGGCGCGCAGCPNAGLCHPRR